MVSLTNTTSRVPIVIQNPHKLCCFTALTYKAVEQPKLNILNETFKGAKCRCLQRMLEMARRKTVDEAKETRSDKTMGKNVFYHLIGNSLHVPTVV